MKVRKFLKIFLIALCIVFFVLIGLPVTIMGIYYLRGTITDAYFVKNATFLYEKLEVIKPEESHSMIRYEKFSETPYFNVSLHRLKLTDKGVVFIIRNYKPNPPLVMDTDAYTKITIRIPELKDENINLEARKDVVALFTKGGSAWPDDGCMKLIDNGSLNVEITGASVKIKLRTKINCGGYYAEVLDINDQWILKELSFSNLNPWLGSTGDHPYSETMRRLISNE